MNLYRLSIGVLKITENYLFFNEKLKKYYYTGISRSCSLCDKPIEDLIYFVVSMLNKEIIIKSFCWNCVNKRQRLITVSEAVTSALICLPDEIPPKSRMVPLVPLIPGGKAIRDMVTRPTSMTVFEAATDMKLEGEIVDHTKHALRESWEESQIGSDPVEMIAMLDSKIKDDSQAFKLLSDLKNSQATGPAQLDKKEEVIKIEHS